MAASFNSFGSRFYGERDVHHDGSFITTEWVICFHLPVFPLRSVRVLKGPIGGIPFLYLREEFAVLEETSPNLKQVFSMYGYLALWVALFLTVPPQVEWLRHSESSTVGYTMVGQLVLLALLPLVLRFCASRCRRTGEQGCPVRQCLVCRRVLRDNSAHCPACGSSDLSDAASPSSSSPPALAGAFVWTRGTVRYTIGLGIFCGLLLAILFAFHEWRLSALERRLDAIRHEAEALHTEEVTREDAARTVEDERSEAGHQALLRNPDYLSGTLARTRHEEEWDLRLTHDSKVALTQAEKNLVRMERVGGDASVQAKAALEIVTVLAAPPGSRVEVLPRGDGFAVRVAFRMSALTKDEEGAVTKHHTTASMRREIEDLSAQVVKDLFDYCGSRGIEKLSVSCNHAMLRALVPPGATPAEEAQLSSRARPSMGNLYRVSLDRSTAREVADWRRISNPQVIARMSVEHDGLKKLTITSGQPLRSDQRDPEGELEF